MFRRAILTSVRNILTSINAQMCTIPENMRLEKSLNKITLLGRVGAEPQTKGNNEHPVIVFSLATHSNYKYANGDFVQKTEWHRICVFKPPLRESVISHLKKGQRVLVFGRMTYGEYKDDDGNMKAAAAVVADDVIFFQS